MLGCMANYSAYLHHHLRLMYHCLPVGRVVINVETSSVFRSLYVISCPFHSTCLDFGDYEHAQLVFLPTYVVHFNTDLHELFL